MSNAYTTQAISGYNSSPPSDDGSQTATNQVKWDTHKTKLSDPVKTLAESINSQTLAAFGKLFGNNVSSKSTAYTVAASDRGQFIMVTGTTTITLLDVATAGADFPLLIVNDGSAVVTIDGNASETINGDTTVTLNPGDFALLTCDGSAWYGAIGLAEVEGTFTATLTGYASGPTGTMKYRKNGKHVALIADEAIEGTSNATTLTMTGIPAILQPDSDTPFLPCIVKDNGGNEVGMAQVASTSITFYMGSPLASTGFTASGTKGLVAGWSLEYYTG